MNIIKIEVGDEVSCIYLISEILKKYKKYFKDSTVEVPLNIGSAYRKLKKEKTLLEAIDGQQKLTKVNIKKIQDHCRVVGEALFSDAEWDSLDERVRKRRSRNKNKIAPDKSRKESIAINADIKKELGRLKKNGRNTYDAVVVMLVKFYKANK